MSAKKTFEAFGNALGVISIGVTLYALVKGEQAARREDAKHKQLLASIEAIRLERQR